MANAPVIPLQVMQAGKESSAGTLVAATHVVDFTPGTATLKRDINMIAIRNSGSYATSHRSYTGAEVVQIDYEAPFLYNRAPVYGNLFLAPLSTGTGNPAATWAFTTISDTDDNLVRYSFEVGGKDVTNAWPQEYQVAGLAGKEWNISIRHGEPWTQKVTLLGMLTTIGARTSALSLPSTGMIDARGVETKVYIDASTIGSTQVVGSVISADIKISNGFTARHTLDALATPYRIARSDPREVTADFVIEYNATTEYTAWAANTARKVRVKATGPSLGATNYIAQFDLYGYWDAYTLANDGNVITQQLTLRGKYDATAASDVTASFTNSVSALTGSL